MPDFYTYFGSKAEVFRALVNEVIRSVQPRDRSDRLLIGRALQPRRRNSGEPMINRGRTTFRVTSEGALDE
jgi:hypothetical protein